MNRWKEGFGKSPVKHILWNMSCGTSDGLHLAALGGFGLHLADGGWLLSFLPVSVSLIRAAEAELLLHSNVIRDSLE